MGGVIHVDLFIDEMPLQKLGSILLNYTPTKRWMRFSVYVVVSHNTISTYDAKSKSARILKKYSHSNTPSLAKSVQ